MTLKTTERRLQIADSKLTGPIRWVEYETGVKCVSHWLNAFLFWRKQ